MASLKELLDEATRSPDTANAMDVMRVMVPLVPGTLSLNPLFSARVWRTFFLFGRKSSQLRQPQGQGRHADEAEKDECGAK